MAKAKQKPIWWNVTMAWGQEDEGTYSESFLAANEEDAKRQCAIDMADSSEFENDDEREKFIEARLDDDNYSDVYKTSDQFRQDLETLFGNMLFGDGARLPIGKEKLGEVLLANRDAIFEKQSEQPRPRG